MIKLFYILILISCGSPKTYVEYPKMQDVGLSLGSKCPVLLSSYRSTIKESIDNNCIECHLEPSSPDLGFRYEADESNSKAFLSLYNGDVAKVLSKLNNQTAHKGGDQISARDEKNIKLLFSIQQLCKSI